MFEDTPAFSGISGTVDIFQASSCSYVSEGLAVNSCFSQKIPEELSTIEYPEIEIRTEGSRKRSACDTSLAAEADNNRSSPSAKRSINSWL